MFTQYLMYIGTQTGNSTMRPCKVITVFTNIMSLLSAAEKKTERGNR